MKPACKTPFFIWFTGRTGSTFLCDLLDSHPQIYCRKEDFSDIRVEDESALTADTKIIEFRNNRFFRRIYTPAGIRQNPSRRESVEYLSQIFSSAPEACGFKFKFPNQAAVPAMLTLQSRFYKNLTRFRLNRKLVVFI